MRKQDNDSFSDVIFKIVGLFILMMIIGIIASIIESIMY